MKLCSILTFLVFAATLTYASDTRTLNVNGLTRRYILHVPAAQAKQSMPLVIVLHGGGGNASSMERYSRFSVLADREDFLVAYPDGIDHHWNDGRQELSNSADDVSFISALIDDVARSFRVDTARVYATGISNGGMMSNRLACELSDRIAAVGLIASSGGAEIMRTCHPAKPVGYVLIAGTADPVVPFIGGAVRILGGRSRGEVIGADKTTQFWAKANGCGNDPQDRTLPDVAHDGTIVRVREYRGCTRPTLLYSIEGGGHTWPSARPYLPAAIVGRTSRQIDATEVLWDFFHSVKK
jgi:polyhydroxybutyrate depolymerase